MKILITGGAGFIGSNLVYRLYKDNEVIVVDNLSTGNYNNIKQLVDNECITFYKKDITSKDFPKFIRNSKFDEIYNFACPASPKYYLEHPIEVFLASVIGVKNILDGVKSSKTKVLHSSTSEIYGDALEHPQKETYCGNCNPIGVRSCYDEGKRAAETIIFDYKRLYNVDVRVVRIFNTYGPMLSKQDGRVMSNFIYNALNNENLEIYGDGSQTRSFCYIDDTLDAIQLLMKTDKKIDSPINVGNPIEMSISQLADIVINKIKGKSKIIYGKQMSDDPKIRRPDISKAKSVLEWEPKISLNEGLEKYIDYIKKVDCI